MSEDTALKAPPEGEAATELPGPSTLVEEGGPTSMAEAFKQIEGDLALTPGDAISTDVSELLTPPDPVEKKEAKPGEAEAKPAEEVEEFGFEKEGEQAAEEEEPALDEKAFDEETEKQVEGLDPKAQDGWRKQRQINKDLRQQVAQLKEQGNPEVQQELERATARITELEERNEQLQASDYTLKVQDSPEYRDKVSVPAKQIKDLALLLSQEFEDQGVTQEEVLGAIRETSLRKRGELIQALRDKMGEDGTDLIVSEVQNAHSAYRRLQADHESMLADAETEWKKTEQRREADRLKAAEEDRALLKRHLDDRWDRFSKALPGLDISSAKRNSGLIDIREETPSNRGYAQMAGEALPLALKEISALRAQLAEAGIQVTREKAASPNLSEGEGTSEVPEKKGPATFAEASAMMGDLAPG